MKTYLGTPDLVISTWRPMDGVRSVGEAFVHLASGNFIILQVTRGKLPEGPDPMMIEKTNTTRHDIVAEVKQSFLLMREHVGAMNDADLAKEADFFGPKMTIGDMLVLAVAHQRESLGQEIAYARMNKIVPPRTAAVGGGE